MPSSERAVALRPAGFSSGALAGGDFRSSLAMQRGLENVSALELSALREQELASLVEAIPSLDLSPFSYVSLHAPSRLSGLSEQETIALLARVPGHWPLVVHPDVIETPDLWRPLGARLCLENMDIRKRTGRTLTELAPLFELLPAAGFCFDIGHARQIDPTMGVAVEMLRAFRDRLRQMHVSEVGTRGEHRPMGYLSRTAFQRVAKYVPTEIPIILETIGSAETLDEELEAVRELFAA